MINATQIPEEISDLITAPKPPVARESAKTMLKFYMQHYSRVQIVRCLKCKKDLCLEILDPDTYTRDLTHSHHEGLRRIEIGGSPLLSSRKRLDGQMGYKCACGNNTINSTFELGLLPSINTPTSSSMIPSIQPHHEAMVKLEIAKNHYKPDVEVNGNKTRIETFEIERLK